MASASPAWVMPCDSSRLAPARYSSVAPAAIAASAARRAAIATTPKARSQTMPVGSPRRSRSSSPPHHRGVCRPHPTAASAAELAAPWWKDDSISRTGRPGATASRCVRVARRARSTLAASYPHPTIHSPSGT
ncbi:MAG TPA: hypothetical protein VGA30_03835 [Actinomycetota bacterium]